MSRTAKRSSQQCNARAQALARQAADRYFAALTSEVPFDNAPGDVDLIKAFTEIQDILLVGDSRAGAQEAAAMNAGYLLGVEVGRRMGGAR